MRFFSQKPFRLTDAEFLDKKQKLIDDITKLQTVHSNFLHGTLDEIKYNALQKLITILENKSAAAEASTGSPMYNAIYLAICEYLEPIDGRVRERGAFAVATFGISRTEKMWNRALKLVEDYKPDLTTLRSNAEAAARLHEKTHAGSN